MQLWSIWLDSKDTAKDQERGEKIQLAQKLLFIINITILMKQKDYCQYIWLNKNRKKPYLEQAMWIEFPQLI